MWIEMLIKLMPVITTAVGIITLLITCFNKEYNNYIELKKKYFECLVDPYIINYRKNKKINPIEYINDNYNYEDTYIPKYINYLVEKEGKYNLHKVLVVDYIEGFKSKENSFYRTFDKIRNVVIIISVFSLFVAINGFMIKTMWLIFEFVNTVKATNLKELLIELLIVAALIIVISLIIFLYFWILGHIFRRSIKDEDIYIYELSNIKKQIEIKIKYYNKNSYKWYIN